MLLSRRETLAGTVAAISILSTPVLAMPAVPPAFPKERIYHDGEPLLTDLTGFHEAEENSLIGFYRLARDGRSAFDFETVVSFMRSARFAQDSDPDHRAVFFNLLSGNYDGLISDDIANRLHARPHADPIHFRTSGGWIMLKGAGHSEIIIKRRDRI